ncbi:MAG: CHAT domain-containing protein, partial [Crocosphaera sp.]
LSQLLAKTPNHCQKLILIPHQYLHLFPIHAVYNPQTNISLAERFKQGIQYSPSCQLLQKIEEKSRQRQDKQPLFFGIQNPTEDLFYGGLEVEIIAENFKADSFVLKEKEASKTKLLETNTIQRLRQSRYVHFSCHGNFNIDSPLNSCLFLAGDKEKDRLNKQELETLKNELFLKDENGVIKPIQKFTLKDIFETINLPQCELVVLSACKTGLTSFQQSVDEYIGLGSGFLYAGSLHVINSLWSVGEFSTAILMIRFYQLMLDKNQTLTIPLALQTAQNWMQTVTEQEIINWLKSLPFNNKEIMQDMIIYLRVNYDENPPFKHPKYWAAFCSLGKVE